MRNAFAVLGMLFLGGHAAMAAPVFSLIDMNNLVGNGNIPVTIGSSGGWGFQITNDSATNWIGANISDFCPTGISPACSANVWLVNGGVTTFGPYTDFFGANFVTVAPNSTLTEFFNPGVPAGVGSIALSSPGINPGDTQTGQVVFVYDLYDADPLQGGNQQGGDTVVALDATVTAISAVSAVPEPGTIGLAGMALAAVIWKRKRAARMSRA